eukprot:TRINITY_DN27069_c0_g1_i1.p1 TRINITY_DN27069_c0_g1~~TRINITY_DN27069_c0_g1_i1.p1  ORF type:complete len:271 (-),score=18.93 TRINITY_DN27069_c0_g1_i1:34-777(-)
MAPEVVTFDVGGRLFKTLRSTVRRHPTTLLACLLDDVSVDSTEPIFVDASPDRFTHFMDWLRYEEMFIPNECSFEALLRDARFFLLPDNVKINGLWHSILPEKLPCTAEACMRDYFDDLKRGWPSFEEEIDAITEHVKTAVHEHVRQRPLCRADNLNDLKSYVNSPFHLQVCVELGSWSAKDTVVSSPYQRPDEYYDFSSAARLILLVSELEQRGFDCTVNRWLDRDNNKDRCRLLIQKRPPTRACQ